MNPLKRPLAAALALFLFASCLDRNVETAVEVYRAGARNLAEKADLDGEAPVTPLEFNRILAGLYGDSMDEAARARGYEGFSSFREDMEGKISKGRLAWIEQTVLNELRERYVVRGSR